MLAAQLTLSIEARPAGRAAGLRSRSAVATHPRVIVPRRGGVAYALLQTDETGASSIVLPATRDPTEAVFPLTIAAHGATRRTLRVLMWPAQPGSGTGVFGLAERWESLRRPNQLAQCGPDGDWLAPDWSALEQGPVLLLLHDTFSTPQSTFASWIADPSFTPVLRDFGGRCLAFAHPTLSCGLEENVAWLVSQVGWLRGPFDIVALGRGGLLARAIAADGRLPLRRVCQVGAPNNGTPLAHEANLLRFLDGHVAMLACISNRVARSTLEGVLCMARVAALGLAAPLPGVAIQATGNLALSALRGKARCATSSGSRSARSSRARAGTASSHPARMTSPHAQRSRGTERGLPRAGRAGRGSPAARRFAGAPSQLLRESARARASRRVVASDPACRTHLKCHMRRPAMVVRGRAAQSAPQSVPDYIRHGPRSQQQA